MRYPIYLILILLPLATLAQGKKLRTDHVRADSSLYINSKNVHPFLQKVNAAEAAIGAEAITETARKSFNAINYVRRNALMKYQASGYYGYHANGSANPPAGTWTIDSSRANPYGKYSIKNTSGRAVGQTVYFDGEKPDTISIRFAVYLEDTPSTTFTGSDGIFIHKYSSASGNAYTSGSGLSADVTLQETWTFVEVEGIAWGSDWDSAYIQIADFDYPTSSFYVGAMQVVKGSKLPAEIYSSNLADIAGFSRTGELAADANGDLYLTSLPVGRLTGTIARSAISTDAVVAPAHKNALENLTLSTQSTGTPADTFHQLTTIDQTWSFGGRVSIWKPSADTVINNIAWMKASGANTMDADHTVILRRNLSISWDKATMDGYDSLTTFTIDADTWNAAGSNTYVFSYSGDIAVDSDYYYFFIWYNPGDVIDARAGTRVDGIQDLFWNTGSGNWSGASKDWALLIRYNSGVEYKLDVTVDNVSGLKTSNLDGNLQEWVGGSLADSANPLRLLLPDTIFIPSGYEANIYWDNICLTTDYSDFVFDVTCDSGQSFAQGWRWTPAAGTTGDYTWSVTARNWAWENVGTASTVLSVSNGDTITPIEATMRVLMIGNSITYQNQYTAQVVTNAGSNAIFLGGINGNSEGWSGKTWSWFESNVESPFVQNTGSNVSLQHYLDSLTYADPTHITIHLGTNDVFNGTTGITSALNAADSLIANFKADAASVKIGICMIIPPAYSQDAAGDDYENGQTRYGYKRNQHTFNDSLKARYGTGGTHYDTDVSLIPVYTWIDTENNMRTTSTALNARNSTTYNRQTDLLHPDSEGGKQMADAIWGWLAKKR